MNIHDWGSVSLMCKEQAIYVRELSPTSGDDKYQHVAFYNANNTD